MKGSEKTKDRLIGMRFRGNKYGLTIWEDTVQSVWILWGKEKMKNDWITKPIFMVKGTLHSYPVHECVFYETENKIS